MIWNVPRSWEGDTVAILAGGYSLWEFDYSTLVDAEGNRPRIITINDSWRLAPTADVHYFCDEKWWDAQMKQNPTVDELDFRTVSRTGFWVKGDVGTRFRQHETVRTLVVRTTNTRGLEKNPAELASGANSGYQAINLAYHFGVSRILLLGYDMHARGPRSHWHRERRQAGFDGLLKDAMLPHFPSLAKPLADAGVEVVNCTPGSALRCFLMKSLEKALKEKPCRTPTLQST